MGQQQQKSARRLLRSDMLTLPQKISHETIRTLTAGAGLVIVGTLLAFTASCMRTVQIGDPALKPFASMYSVDRPQYGFSPLPNGGPVSIEGKASHGGYYGMIAFCGRPSPATPFSSVRKSLH